MQVGGGLRTVERIDQLLQLGVKQAIVGTIAVEQPELVKQLCLQFPQQIIVGIDARNGKVATRGWLETSEVEAIELAQRMASYGAAAIIYTDIHRDGTLTGPNMEALRELAHQIEIPVIASGGVSSLTDLLSLLALEPLGVTGAIVGRAIYTGEVDLAEAVQAVGQGREKRVEKSRKGVIYVPRPRRAVCLASLALQQQRTFSWRKNWLEYTSLFGL